MVFDKPSTRTRVSFDLAMRQLGQETIVLNQSDMQLGRGESIADTAQVLARFADAVMVRTGVRENITAFAAHANVPVLNGLTAFSHPCQIIADLMTFEEHKGCLAGQRIAWLGDGNNVAVSFVHAAALLDFELALATPEIYAVLKCWRQRVVQVRSLASAPLPRKPRKGLLRWSRIAGCQ